MLLNEPYVYSAYLINESLSTISTSIPKGVEDMKTMTFEEFNELKNRWLSNLDFIWLICGHLTENDALEMVRRTESSIKFNKIAFETVSSTRAIFLRDRTVYTLRFVNPGKTQPNAYCKCLFQYDDDGTAVHVMMSLLKEKIFNQLRTQEQLGYIVHSGFHEVAKVNHAFIGVQSSTKDADFLEHRINSLLASLKEKWPFTKKDIKKIVEAKVKATL